MDKKSLSHTAWKCQYHICMLEPHVHLRVSISPKMSISIFVGYLREKSFMTGIRTCRVNRIQHSRREAIMSMETVGDVKEEAIKKYIVEQSEESRKEDSEGAAF